MSAPMDRHIDYSHEDALHLPERRRPRRKERSAQGKQSINLVDLANRACEPLSSHWPEDKVCIGMRACKDLRGMLVMVPLVRLQVRRKVEDPVLAFRWLSRFYGKVQLCAGERIKEGEGIGGRERRALPSFDARCRKDDVEGGELGRSIADLITISDQQQQQDGQHCSGIQWTGRVTTLSLVNLLLGEDIARIAGALHRMTMLESLELECIQQGTEESWIQCFCASLPQLKRLKKLSLSRSKLSDDGIAALSSCFPLCASLHDLDLSRSSLRCLLPPPSHLSLTLTFHTPMLILDHRHENHALAPTLEGDEVRTHVGIIKGCGMNQLSMYRV
jgi:hypothetical protein